MTVTLISMVYPHPRPGFWPGIERQVGELARALQAAGASVTVITTFRNGGEGREMHDGIDVRRIADSGRFSRLGYLFNGHVRSLGRGALALSEVMSRSDVIESFIPLPGSPVLQRPGLSVFAFFAHRDRPSRVTDFLHQPMHFAMEKRFYRSVQGVIVASSESRRVLIREYGVDPAKIIVIPLGVSDRFHASGDPVERAPGSEARLLYVGPLIPRKGLPTLVEALALLRRRGTAFRLLIAGRGPERASIEALASRRGVGDAVEFAGFVEEERLAALYAEADVFLFPSLKEGFGLVLVEAMARGVPIVASSTPPIPEVVGDAGRFFTAGVPAALADALSPVLRDRDLRAAMREAGLKRAKERYDWSRIAERTLEVYRGERRA